jgi:predicted helicase
MRDVFEAYLHRLRQDRADKTEHSDRGALEDLLNAAAQAADPAIRIIHEAKKVAGSGAPDFKVIKTAMILGYVENKTIGENLDQILKSDQIARYKALSNNILLTDYLQFIWIKDGKIGGREIIAFPDDLEGKPKKPREDRVKAVSDLLRGFFSTAPEGIGRAQQLALALATRSHYLRDFLDAELRRQEKEHQEGRLYGLYQVFRDQVFHELTLGEFADAFAQMLAYGLFLAKLNSSGAVVSLANARQFVPGSFRLIRELVQFLDDLSAPEYAEIRWVIEEILSIVNGLDLAAIHDDLSFKHRKAVSRKVRAKDEEEHRLFERDPFIYFYEDFLAKYDAKMKKARGVYYTPPPIVNFIVRAIDDVLKDTFKIKDGLADHSRVTVLDFACGTGTFILEVLERIFENIGGADSGKANLIVRDHMLKNVFGFEYLIAPYTIAHLKLSQYLADKGHALKDGERLQVFLTNTLEPMEAQKNLFLPALSEESASAQRVKEKPILVITGNPPYAGHSKNKGAWITASIDEYKFTRVTDADGRERKVPLGERNPKWLNDDYVKFIRFAQMKMDGGIFKVEDKNKNLREVEVDGVEEGVVGIITNHSWLDNPTFRGMRQSLMRSFDQIYVLDLHGNAKKKERAPDGSKDENVFDIEQGVAISFFVKKPGLERGVWRGDLWGKRLEKYEAAAEGTLANDEWSPLRPVAPFFLFARQDAAIRAEYDVGWRLPDIYPTNVLGFQTHRDAFAVSFTEAEMGRKLAELADPNVSDDDLMERYGLRSNRDWSFSDARIAARKGAAKRPQIIAYRPFDDRWSEFSSLTMDYPRRELLDHVAGKDNLCLVASRQIGTRLWRHGFVTVHPPNDCLISNRTKEANQVFPAWKYLDGETLENVSSAFRDFLDVRYGHHYQPEEILSYIYAVLHAPTYRARYAEFLRIDFPRIPFPEKRAAFAKVSALGGELVQKHLLRDVPALKLGRYRGKGEHEVEKPRYAESERAVYINATQSFAPVPIDVWNFHIGGYQVIDKYLKSRKGRKLTLDEIQNVENVVNVLAFTIEHMQKIDGAYRTAFPDRG